jgi:adenylate cyclase
MPVGATGTGDDAGREGAAAGSAALPRVSAAEIAAESGMSVEQVHRLWRALALPVTRDDAFTPADRDLVVDLAQVARDAGTDEELAVALARSLGHHTNRLATWQVMGLVESLADARGLGPEDAARQAATFTEAHLDDLQRVLVAVWRRQMASVTGWRLGRAGQDARALPLTVGFVDMVSYTALTARLPERDMADILRRFESLCVDVVHTHGGRIIKTMGDEALFVADAVVPAVRIGLDLVDAAVADSTLPDVRGGIATGTVISMLGDVYGRTVNLASRLTHLASPARLLLDPATAEAVEATAADLTVSPQPAEELNGVGSVEPHAVWRRDA